MRKIKIEKNVRLTLATQEEVVARSFEPTTAEELEHSGFLTIDSRFPSNFETDLLRAGKIEDPFYSTNPIKMQHFESTHIWYHTRFAYGEVADENTFLVFEGIDTVADIYLNGQKIGHTENMFVKHEFCVPFLKQGENELVVHITPAAVYAKKFRLPAINNALPYNVDALSLRKCASSFGWDIMPRLVTAGIWRDVYIEQKPRVRLEDLYLFTTDLSEDGTAQINASYYIESGAYCLRNAVVEIVGVCGDSSFRMRGRVFNANGRLFCKEKCKLWYPKNYGEQNLYDVTARLYAEGELLDERKLRFGVRTVSLERTSTMGQDGGKFQFYVNGQRIFIMGTNWVPLSPYLGDAEGRLTRALELAEDVGCNAIRCWGGGVYEDDKFFDFCDEKGILVWQDFMMACGIYPQNARFQTQLREEAEYIVKKLRNHPSLLLWAGDNECDQNCRGTEMGFGRDPNRNVLTRSVLRDVVAEQDFMRPYLPSSPYMDERAIAVGEPLSEDHLWGPRDYFKGAYYKNAQAAFASELGYHGCPSVASLKRYIAPEKLWPITKDGFANEDWLTHATAMETERGAYYTYRIDLMIRHVETLFGEVPNDLETFVLLSQISQAEAKKYFIERFRIKKWGRSGVIWWNLLDGWPQISDAVVDYYFDKKLAYEYIKRSQQPICFMLDEPENGKCVLYGVNDTQTAFCGKITIRKLTTGEIVSEADVVVPQNESVPLGQVEVGTEQACYYMEWRSEDGKTQGVNHYYANMPSICAAEYLGQMRDVGLLS